jgi:hypothetical protein
MGKKSRRNKTKQTAEELAQIKINIKEQVSITNNMGQKYMSKRLNKLIGSAIFCKHTLASAQAGHFGGGGIGATIGTIDTTI